MLHVYWLLNRKVSQGCSPAGENAGSLTPFEMTFFKNDPVRKNPNCTTTKRSPTPLSPSPCLRSRGRALDKLSELIPLLAPSWTGIK